MYCIFVILFLVVMHFFSIPSDLRDTMADLNQRWTKMSDRYVWESVESH